MFSSLRPVKRIKSKVISSTGKKPTVAPYSGAILDKVALSAKFNSSRPSPKYSTNLPTTPNWRSRWVMVSTRSVAITPSLSFPTKRTPTTSGINIEIGCPNRAASASIPPTPQASTDNPFTIGVCESVPTTVSGNKMPSSVGVLSLTTWDKYSKFTWWQIPVPGGTTRKLLNALCPHFKNS